MFADLNEKVALITGGGQGLGLGIVLKMAEQGADIAIADLSDETLRQAADQVEGMGRKVYTVKMDVTDKGSVTAGVNDLTSQAGQIDILVNNAGYGAFYEWEEFPEDEIIRQTTVLFSAPILLCKAFAPLMSKEQKGIIVNLTSLATLYPLPYMPLYNAGKSALSSFTQSLMLEYPNFPKLIDFRSGDVRTSFNLSAPKQALADQPLSMKRAWTQIENQLEDSPGAEVVCGQLFRAMKGGGSGVRYGGGLRSNVMIVPHHGSNTSSSQLLLDVVQPDIAIVSRGARNRFGHPQADVVRRYDEKRVIWLDTAEQGAVLVKVEQGRVDWRAWADTQMRFWHSPQHSFMR